MSLETGTSFEPFVPRISHKVAHMRCLMHCLKRSAVLFHVYQIKKGAALCVCDDAGLYLPHRAIQSGSIQCLKGLVELGQDMGYSTKTLMSFKVKLLCLFIPLRHLIMTFGLTGCGRKLATSSSCELRRNGFSQGCFGLRS